MESFATGFEANGCVVKEIELKDIKADFLAEFKPDLILGYDYSYLMDERCAQLVEDYPCKNKFFYFADEPQSRFASGEKEGLFEKLSELGHKVFIWDRGLRESFENCFYLPLAASPVKYATDFSSYKYDISFVGRPLTEKRQEILCKLINSFGAKLSIFCYEEHFKRSVKEIREQGLLDENEMMIYENCWKGFVKTEEDLARIYNSSRINLNITEQGRSSLNYRVFEVLASGGFLLTDEREELQDFFIPSKHLEVYKNFDDLSDKIDFYLKNLNIAQKIAQLGRFQCIENHNFSARARVILKKAGE